MNISRKVLSVVVALALAGLPVFESVDTAFAKTNAKGSALEGTWVVTVNLVSPPPGFPLSFTALETYSSGGGLVTSNNLPPVPRPGQGEWSKIKSREYNVAIQFFLFDPTGSHAGSVKVTHSIELVTKDQYTGIGRADFFDLSGNLLASISFTTEGQRLRVE